jgi:hypothetical protein
MILAVGILSIVIVSIASMTESITGSLQVNNVQNEKEQLLGWIRTIGSDINSIRTSLQSPVNSQFKACICGGTLCTSDQTYPLTLFDSIGSQVAGPSSSPFFYDNTGASCLPNASNCYFQVTTSFLSECAPIFTISFDPQPSCLSGAEFVEVAYTITPTTWANAHGNLLGTTTSGSVFTEVSDITTGWTCPQ